LHRIVAATLRSAQNTGA